ncbi:MAG: DUF4347 domain-containing protein [Synechococcales cyanobacterium CRU_2_2]|nr:DUF4347 domain-containing protein [Synechococcales cyanobacterium CRU_2_2]
MPPVTVKDLVLIDSGVFAPAQLAAGVVAGMEVHRLNRGDAIAQITAIFQAKASQNVAIANVHILCHGAPGCLYLGDRELSLDTLDQYTTQLKAWFRCAQGALLLYGCQVAAGDAGEEFIDRLHAVVDRPILASAQRVGQVALGGELAAEFLF